MGAKKAKEWQLVEIHPKDWVGLKCAKVVADGARMQWWQGQRAGGSELWVHHMPICKHWQSRSCERGNSCTYAHVGPGGISQQAPSWERWKGTVSSAQDDCG